MPLGNTEESSSNDNIPQKTEVAKLNSEKGTDLTDGVSDVKSLKTVI